MSEGLTEQELSLVWGTNFLNVWRTITGNSSAEKPL